MASGRIATSISPSAMPRCAIVTVSGPIATSRERRVAAGEDGAHAIGLAHEGGDERVVRRVVELARRAFLRDHRPVHHDDPVGDRERLRLVVRHVDHREARAAAADRGSPRASAGAAARRGSTAARRRAAPPARARARGRRPRAAAGRRRAPRAGAGRGRRGRRSPAPRAPCRAPAPWACRRRSRP